MSETSRGSGDQPPIGSDDDGAGSAVVMPPTASRGADAPPPASDVALGLLLLVLAGAVVGYLDLIPNEAEMILRIAAVGAAISGVGILGSGLRRRSERTPAAADDDAGPGDGVVRRLLARRLLIVPAGEVLMVGVVLGFVLVVPRLGFAAASAALVLLMLGLYRERRWYWIAPAAALAVLGLNWLFFDFLSLRPL